MPGQALVDAAGPMRPICHATEINGEALAEARADANRWRRLFAKVINEYAGGRFVDDGELMPCLFVCEPVYETRSVACAVEAAIVHGTDLGKSFDDPPGVDDAERRRRISDMTPTAAELEAAASPPPQEWYDEMNDPPATFDHDEPIGDNTPPMSH